MWDFIPNSLAEILTESKSISINEWCDKYGDSNRVVLQEYFTFLSEAQYIVQEIGNIVDIPKNQSIAYNVKNIIIELDFTEDAVLKNLYCQLSTFLCHSAELRITSQYNLSQLCHSLHVFCSTPIKNFVVFLKYNQETNDTELTKIMNQYLKINIIIVHGAPFNDKIELFNSSSIILFSTSEFDSRTSCGCIGIPEFSYKRYLDSEKKNSCLFGKISVLANGTIVNCPSMKSAYGNVVNDKLEDIIILESFKSFGLIDKDQISVCQICEFRRFCLDCRAFVKEPKDILSKPNKCNYDPYTATWKNQFDKEA